MNHLDPRDKPTPENEPLGDKVIGDLPETSDPLDEDSDLDEDEEDADDE